MQTKWLVLGFGVVAITTAGIAADKVWSGASTVDGNWSRPENWAGAGVPVAGDALIFGGSTRLSNNNDLSAGTVISGITFPAGAGAFELTGNQIALDGDIRNESTVTKKFALPLWLQRDSVLFGSNASINIEGVVSGPGGLHAAVTNTVYLSGNNSYEGVTTVSNGCRLLISHPNALGSTAGGTRVHGLTGSSLRLEGGITVAEPITLVNQIPPWINCLTAGGGSNIITGTLYKEKEVSIGVDWGSTLIFRGGVKHVSGGGTMALRHSGTMVFEEKPIEFGTAAAVQAEGAGTTVLAVPGNTFSTLRLASGAKVRTDVVNALPSSSTLCVGASWGPGGLLDLNGYDQTVGVIMTDPRWSDPGYLAVTSALPATLTVNQGGNSVYAGAFDGAVTLVKNNGGRITITNVISTTTGELCLNGGSIVIAETAGFSACRTVRVSGGTLDLRNASALPDTVAVRLQNSAKIAIKEGVTVTVDKLFLDGEQQVAGTWGAAGSGADHVNDTFFSGLGTLNVISGTQVVYADAVWDGGGAGAGDGFSAAANWDGDALPSFDGFARAIFATGGSTATVDTPATFTKMTFNAASDFTVVAGAGTLTVGGGGIKAGASTPSSSDRTYTIASDLTMDDHQFWNITKNGTGTTYLHVSGAISDGGNAFNLTQRGDSVLILSGNNSYGGVTTIATNYAIVRHPNALGSAAGNTIVQDGAYLVVEGGFTLNEPITINGDDVIRWSGTLRSNAGTNTLAAKLTSSYARIRTNGNGCWEVIGGVDGGRLICSAVSGTYIRFAEKPITAGGLTCHTYGGTVILAVAGNTFTSMEAGGNELRVDVPNAWPANLFLRQGSQGSAGSILNFNGNDQSVGTLIGDYAGSGVRVTYSVAPMTLTVDQSDNTIYNAMITGAVSVVKLGTGKLTLTNAYHTTSGSFTVSNGTLSVSNFGSLGPNSTNIVVGGSGTLDLSSTNPSMIADTAVVTMPESGVSTAKINLAAGVNESVGWLFYGDKMKRAGTYGASGSAATYKDNTHFSGTGVLKVLHDNAGTLMWLR